jgi:hypothetical protein
MFCTRFLGRPDGHLGSCIPTHNPLPPSQHPRPPHKNTVTNAGEHFHHPPLRHQQHNHLPPPLLVRSRRSFVGSRFGAPNDGGAPVLLVAAREPILLTQLLISDGMMLSPYQHRWHVHPSFTTWLPSRASQTQVCPPDQSRGSRSWRSPA